MESFSLRINILVTLPQQGEEMIQKLAAGNTWQVFAGLDNMIHYVLLSSVIGVKYPDPTTGGVVLRLNNGDFISLATSEGLSSVLAELGAS